MASQVPRDHVYGNFKPSKTELEKEKRTRKSSAQRRDGNDPKHLAVIRLCPCVGCMTTRVKIDPHHLVAGRAVTEGGRCFGRRAVDAWTVPVCRTCHEIAQRAQGAKELDLFQSWGYENVYDLAEFLYDAPRDVRVYTSIILANRQVKL